MSEFLAMGGYAFYVWTAYGASALAIFGLIGAIWLKHLSTRRALDALERERAE